MNDILKFLSHPVIISLLPWLLGGLCGMILLTTFRHDRRMRKKGALFPMEILGLNALFSALCAMSLQYGMSELIAELAKLPALSWKIYIAGPVLATIFGWGWHRFFIYRAKGDQEKINYWKCKYYKGRDNMDMDGDGVPDDQRSDHTMMAMVDDPNGEKDV